MFNLRSVYIVFFILINFIYCGAVKKSNNKSPVDEKTIKYENVKKYTDFSIKNRKYIEWIAKNDLIIEDKGVEAPIDYTKYGKFKNVGTSRFRYYIKKRRLLKKAVGEGIYPNWNRIRRKKEFKKLQATGLFSLSHWDKIFMRYPKLGFYRWVIASESSGVKQFYIALTLEKLGLYLHALKAYQSLLFNFPKTISYTEWQTLWYPSIVARDKIKWILRRRLNKKFDWENSVAYVENSYDNDLSNDKYFIYPGKFVKKAPKDYKDVDNKTLKIKKSIGKGDTKIVQYNNNHWQYFVKGKPSIIKAVSYSPNKIGTYPNRGHYSVNYDFFKEDVNKNGIIDALYESYIDKNKNGKKDKNEKRVGDLELLKQMGCNTIRIYDHGKALSPKILREIHKKSGIYFILGDYVGMYALGSGATWKEGTDYRNPKHRKNMIKSIKKLVNKHKNERYVSMWMIGNESNYPVANNASKYPAVYYKFVNKIAKLIKKLDPLKRPVAHCNGDLGFLHYFQKYCPDVDVYGANIYRDANGFGQSVFEAIKRFLNKPILVTEYGIGAYSSWHSVKEAEDYQADYHRQSWQDMLYNSAKHYGCGNSIGGVVFEFLDEWWKYEGDGGTGSNRYKQDRKSSFPLTGMDGLSYEEWYGVFSQGKGTDSPFLRVPRKSFYVYKNLWNK